MAVPPCSPADRVRSAGQAVDVEPFSYAVCAVLWDPRPVSAARRAHAAEETVCTPGRVLRGPAGCLPRHGMCRARSALSARARQILPSEARHRRRRRQRRGREWWFVRLSGVKTVEPVMSGASSRAAGRQADRQVGVESALSCAPNAS